MILPYDTSDVELSLAKKQVKELHMTGKYLQVWYKNRSRDVDGRSFARVYVEVTE